MLRLCLVLIIFAIGSVAAVRSRFGALLFYIWFALFLPQQFLWTDITPYRPSLLIGLFLVMSCLATGIFPNFKHPFSRTALLFLLPCAIATAIAIVPSLSTAWLEAMVRLFVVCLFLIALVKSRNQFVILMAVISASFGFHSVKAGMMALVRGTTGRYLAGIGGSFSDNNAYAIGTAMIIFILLAAAQNLKSRYISSIYLLGVPLSIVTIVFTYSRSGFLALVGAGFFFISLQRRKILLLISACSILLLILAFVPIPEAYKQRIDTIRTYDEIREASALSRIHYWKTAISIAGDNPLGIGLWCFESAYDKYDSLNGMHGRKRSVHNSFLQALTETGWLGGFLFLFIIMQGMVIGFRIRSRAASFASSDRRFYFTMSNALLSSMTAFIVGGFFISMAYVDLMWLILASIAALDLIQQSSLPERSRDGEISSQNSIDTTQQQVPTIP